MVFAELYGPGDGAHLSGGGERELGLAGSHARLRLPWRRPLPGTHGWRVDASRFREADRVATA